MTAISAPTSDIFRARGEAGATEKTLISKLLVIA
jgi:hypothetical protein